MLVADRRQRRYRREAERICTAVIDGETVVATAGESIYVELGQPHRITNMHDEILVIIEVQLGQYTGEDDICRLEDDYGRALFTPQDFARLADQLAGIQGRFLLSINDVPEIRELFGAFDVQPVETTYGISRQAAAKAAPRAELLISG